MFNTLTPIQWNFESPNTFYGQFTGSNNRLYDIFLNRILEENLKPLYLNYITRTPSAVPVANILTAIEDNKVWNVKFYDNEYYNSDERFKSYDVNGSGKGLNVFGTVLSSLINVAKNNKNLIDVIAFTGPPPRYTTFYKKLFYSPKMQKWFTDEGGLTGLQEIITKYYTECPQYTEYTWYLYFN